METQIFSSILLASTLLLSGCTDDSASFEFNGRDNALSIFRVQPYFWEDGVEVAVVVSRLPECQRRHPLDRIEGNGTPIEVYEPDPQRFVLRENNRWYRVDTESCSLESIETLVQGEQGTLQGKFEEDDLRRLVFVAARPLAEK